MQSEPPAPVPQGPPPRQAPLREPEQVFALRSEAAAEGEYVTWARLDDGFHSHPKVLAAWAKSPAAVGLHARALSYAANHEQDGRVSRDALSALAHDDDLRDEAVQVLTDAGLWHENGDGYVIHDFLDYNPSRESLTERRKADRERKAKAS